MVSCIIYIFPHLQITSITEEERADIEVKTRGQGSSTTWKSERLKRITSSNFGEICKAGDKKDLKKLAKRLMTASYISSPAMKHGIMYETVAVDWFEKNVCKTHPAGLFISHEIPFLGASPDRVIDDNTLLEIKCPYSAKDSMITPENVPYLFYNEKGELALKKDHFYFFQIQGQLYCAERNACKFLIFTLKDRKIIEIKKDADFCSDMIEKLTKFFIEYFKPQYLERFLYKRYYDFTFSY